MFENIYRENFNGLGVGRIARDCDFFRNPGFYLNENEYAIQYMFAGDRYFFSADACYKMEAGCMAFIHMPDFPQTCLLGGSFHDRLLLEMETKHFSQLGGMMNLDFPAFFRSHCGVYQLKDNNCAQNFLRRLEQIMRTPPQVKTMPSREFQLKAELLRFFSRSSTWENDKLAPYDESRISASIIKQKRIHDVSNYLREHFTEIRSVEELSERFHLSKSYLCGMFKEITNFTLTERINMYRIAASKQYLLDRRYNMTEIAQLLGYDSLTYFERIFKKYVGSTPSQYRKAHAAG